MPNQKYRSEAAREDLLLFAAGDTRKPVISYFSGITLRVRFGDAQQRIYAEYGENVAAFDFRGNLLEGSLPEKQRMYVAVWADLRRGELAVLRQMMETVGEYFKIRGLD